MRKLFFYILLIAIIPQAGLAQGTTEKIKQAISKASASLRTVECDFTQTKQSKLLSDKMAAKGRMAWQRHDKLRWEYTSPYASTFILNGQKAYLKTNGRNRTINTKRNKGFKEIARLMMKGVTGGFFADTKGFKSQIAVTRTEWIATFFPLRNPMKRMFSKIVIHFSRHNAMASMVELTGKNGDVTRITFHDMKTNINLNPTTFAP